MTGARAARRGSGQGPIVGCALLLIGLAVAYYAGSPEQRLVTGPAFALVALATTLAAILVRRAALVPLDEIGLLHGATVMLYGAVPLLVYLALGMRYTPLNDSRLFAVHPAPEEVGRIGWFYVVYLAGFVAAYLLGRGRASATSPAVLSVGRARLCVVVAFWVGASLVLAGIAVAFSLSAASYTESYLVVQRLPTFVRQVHRLAAAAQDFLGITLLIVLFAAYRRWRWLIALWIGVVAVGTLLQAGERTSLMTTIAAAMILYNRFVRPVRAWVLVLVGTLGLAAFMALGIYRGVRQAQAGTEFSTPVSAGEFELVFGNAVDIARRKESGELGEVPLPVYFSDAVGLIPSQLLPFEKTDVANWYLDRFYPDVKAVGGGLAFGVAAQSILGFGLVEALLRGLALGLLFGAIQRWYRRRSASLWATGAFLWLAVHSYHAVRYSTFAVFTSFVQEALAVIVVAEVCRRVLVYAVSREADPGPAPAPAV